MTEKNRSEKEKYKEICEELDKIIEYIRKDDEEKNSVKKMQGDNRIKLRDKTKTARLQVAEIYRDFYNKCAQIALKSNFSEHECEPSYKIFYPMYLEIPEDDNDYSNNEDINGNIAKAIERFSKSIDNFYNELSTSKRLKLVECSKTKKNSKKKNKAICLAIKTSDKFLEETDKKTNKITELVAKTESDAYINNKGKNNNITRFDEEILVTFKKRYFVTYQIFLAVLWSIPFSMSWVMIIGFFYQLFTDSSILVKLKQEIIIIEFISFLIVLMCIRMGIDFSILDNKKKTVPSNLTKFFLMPFFFILTIKYGKFVNPFKENIVLYVKDKNELVMSKITSKCPICQSANRDSMLKLKTKRKLVVAECKEEPLHVFSFDHVTKKGFLLD